jgi:predicted nucleic acid-binding protein
LRYFDTSFLAPLILEEATSGKVEAFVAKLPAGELCVSHWTRTEFASLLSREVRMGGLMEDSALAAMDQFDSMVGESFQVLAPGVADFDLATRYIKHFATKLRAGDALHLAIAFNHGTQTLYTLDEGLLAAAKLLKVPASRGIRP